MLRLIARAVAAAVLAAALSVMLLAETAAGADCTRTSVGLTALNELGSGDYRGSQGGLYPGATNTRPAAHDAAGLALARAIEPRDASGNADPNGRYAFVSIGMSNTTQEFQAFKPIADADPTKDPRLVIVDGAQGGVTATAWANLANRAWDTLDARLAAAGVTRNQVAVAWVKVANANPVGAFPTHAQTLQSNMASIAQNLKARFPNIKLAYYSSRVYGGYASSPLNPEPYAHESAFAVKWLIEDQLSGSAALQFDAAKGSVNAPWLAWGPYLWADGTVARHDGLTWLCSDFAADGTHPSTSGRTKVAELLLAFLKSDSTAREWFLSAPATEGVETVPAPPVAAPPAPDTGAMSPPTALPALSQPAPARAADSIAPRQRIRSRRRQDIDRIAIFVRLDEPATITARATATVSGARSKVYRFTPLKRKVSANVETKLQLRLRAPARAAVKRALSRGKKVTATIRLLATDISGNLASAKRTIMLTE